MSNLLKNKKRLHFIGIGGSGMYPLVQILHKEGYHITGSDNNMTDTITSLTNMGIKVFMEQKSENIADSDLIIYSAAIMENNEELQKARLSGIQLIKRSELLGEITSRYNKAICISGTHGKTTVCAMLTQILLDAGKDPSAVIGGKLKSIGGGGRAGKSDIMVCEACEFSDTFLKLFPSYSIILNIDEDHMEYFKTLDNLINSFKNFANLSTNKIIANGDDQNTNKVLTKVKKPMVTFGFGESNNFFAKNIEYTINNDKKVTTSFDVYKDGSFFYKYTIHIPGEHNILNALAAIVAALEVDTPREKIQTGLSKFSGAGRRFEVLGIFNDITIADDYAHHPAEIKVTLESAKKMGYQRVWAVHQPFTYSRTSRLLEDFADVLKIADKVVISDIMGGREENIYGVHSKDLQNKIEGCVYLPSFDEIVNYLSENARPGDLIMTIGCGDVNKISNKLVEIYAKKTS